MLYALIVSYEFIVMPTPPRPLLQAALFVVFAPMGLLSTHHFTWLILAIMLGYHLERRLWLAPNIFVDIYIYTVATAIMFLVYLVYLIVAGLHPCEPR
jgi:hypothetical protein